MPGEPEDTWRERPNRHPLPPLLFVGALALGYALQEAAPLALPFPGLAKALGALSLGAGLAGVLWASTTLMRAGTAVLPHRGASRLVTGGPFAFSRNPIYLGEVLIVLGLAGVEASLAYGVAAAVFALLVTHFAIRREEAHLAARFGKEWDAYAARVRRWI